MKLDIAEYCIIAQVIYFILYMLNEQSSVFVRKNELRSVMQYFRLIFRSTDQVIAL